MTQKNALAIDLIRRGYRPFRVACQSSIAPYILAKAGGLGPGDGLRWSLIIFSLMGFVAAWLFWLARRTIREEMAS